MTSLIPPADIVPKKIRQRSRLHKWSEPIPFEHHTERHCQFCSLIRVTMHTPDGKAWREFKYGMNGKQFQARFTPRCDPSAEAS